MGAVISEDILIATGMSEKEMLREIAVIAKGMYDGSSEPVEMPGKEMLREIAVLLFKKDKLTLGRAAQLADMNLMKFQRLLAERKIPVHYDVAEFNEDMETLNGKSHK